MAKWVADSEAFIKSNPGLGKFGVVVDMTQLKPLSKDCQDLMVKGQQLFAKAGMQRSCVCVPDVITRNQFKTLAKASGIYAFERYVDSQSTPNWEPIAEGWVKNGADPDIKAA